MIAQHIPITVRHYLSHDIVIRRSKWYSNIYTPKIVKSPAVRKKLHKNM